MAVILSASEGSALRKHFVGERGSGEHEEILIRDLDLDMVQEMRDDWQFYRDRRPESYTSIPKP